MKLLSTLTIILSFLVQSTLSAQDKDLSLFTQKYDSILHLQQKGIAVLVKQNGQISTVGLGDFNLDEHSVFNIGSATKTFTAILIMQEVEKGNIKLTDSIGKYLTPLRNVDPGLSVQALITHESGLDEIIGRNIADIFYGKNDSLYETSLLHEIEANQPELIGEFDYCNTNYFLLGKIIEKVTDQSYFDLVRERILVPLKMEHTHPYLHKNIPHLAPPYDNGEDLSQYLDYRYFANIAYAAGSIGSTLLDMERFYTGLFDSEILLKAETVEQMMTAGNETYGLGLFKLGDEENEYFGHGGNNIGYAFRNAYDPSTGDLFLVFSNALAIPIEGAITEDLYATLKGETLAEFQKVSTNRFEHIPGKYFLKEANLTLEIKKDEDKFLLVVEAQGITSELFQKDDITLYESQVGATLQIIEGNDDALVFQQSGFETNIVRVEE